MGRVLLKSRYFIIFQCFNPIFGRGSDGRAAMGIGRVTVWSLDHGASQDFATHYAWLPTNRYGIECLAGLDQVPAAGATLIVGAPKITGGTGGQARIFAMV